MFNELSYLGFGHIEIGTVTPKAQPGNPKPRLFRLPKDKALINRMGFNNGGILAAAEHLKKRKIRNYKTLKKMKKKTIDNIVRLLFFPFLFIFLLPPSIFKAALPVVGIIGLSAVIWCFYRQENSFISFIFLILYILLLGLIGMMS